MSQAEQTATILIVDDMPVIVKMLKKQLEHWGYRVLTALTGEEGLDVAQQQRPDLVLLDILLPRMKGREVCAKLKADERTRRIPIIFLTALGLSDHVRTGLEIGAEDYIVKPFRASELKERVQVCLLRSRRPLAG